MDQQTEAKIQEIVDAPSLYPEIERKDRATRLNDMVEWLDKYKEVNTCYNLYGMDRIDALNCDDWLDMGTFSRERYLKNCRFQAEETGFYYDHTIFTRNKLTFEHLMSYWYGPQSGLYIPSLGAFMNNVFYLHREDCPIRMEPFDFDAFLSGLDEGKRLVFKQGYGEKGKQVFVAVVEDGGIRFDGKHYTAEAFKEEYVAPFRTWVVQEYLIQHPAMAAFNESSVNTLRMVTYHLGDRVVLDDAAIRIGQPGNYVDNAYSNGLYANIKDDGTLEESMFCFATKTREKHRFQDAVIPFYDKAVALVKDAHARIPEVFEIGWDVAFTERGPLLVEANDGGAVFVVQTGWGHAGRPSWNRYLAERTAFEAANGRS